MFTLIFFFTTIYFCSIHFSNELKTNFNNDKILTSSHNFFNSKTRYILKNYISNNHNINGILLSLQLADFYLNNNELSKSLNVLKKSKKLISEVNFLNLILLKIAKIQLEKKEFKEAISTINSITESTWNNVKNNFKGDIQFSLGHIKEAVKNWKISLINSKNIELNEIIKLKLNEYDC